MFAQLGIPVYGIRICAQVRDNRKELTRTAHELLFLNILMGLISYIILGVLIVTVPRLRQERTLYIVISFTIILTAIGMNWLYQALEQYTYITIRSIIFKIIAILAMFLLVHEQEDYVIYGAISIFAASASNICNFINVHKYIDLKFVGKYNIRRHIKPVLVFFAMSCATTIYTNLDTVMLGFMKTDEDVGYYNTAVKIKSILVSLVTSLGAVLLPRASYYIKQGNMSEFKRINKKALNFVFLVSCPLTVYFIMFAKAGIFFLSGKEFGGSILPMQIIMPTLIFIGVSNILGIQMLIPLGKEKIVLYSEIAGAAVDLIINALLIPRYASAGAAIGTVVAELVVVCFQAFALRNDIGQYFKGISYIKILIAVVTSTVVCIWFTQVKWSNFSVLISSGCTFFAIYGGVLLVLREKLTIEVVKGIFEKKNSLQIKSQG